MSGRVLFYVQHLLGVGHVARAAAIARGLAANHLDVLVVLGGEAVPHIDFGGAKTLQMASARALDMSFSVLVDENSKPIGDAWRERRCAELTAAYLEFKPDILLVEHFPFGRRSFSFELLPLFEIAKGDGCRIVGSIRDVLVQKSDGSPEQAKKTNKILALLRRWFDKVLVHGDPAVVPFTATFPQAHEVADLLAYTGYVVDRRPAGTAGCGADAASEDGTDEIIVSVGGGAVGEALLRTALQARMEGCQMERRWRLLAGANLDEIAFIGLMREALGSRSGAGIEIERARPDFRQLLGRCALSISQAGYNTLMDVMGAGCPALMVPFAAGAETEQLFRARIFEEKGLISVLEENELASASLAAAVDRALAQSPDRRSTGVGSLAIDLSGVETTARLLAVEAAEVGRARSARR